MDPQDVDAGGLGLHQDQVGCFVGSKDGLAVEERSNRLLGWPGGLNLRLRWAVRGCGPVGCLDQGHVRIFSSARLLGYCFFAWCLRDIQIRDCRSPYILTERASTACSLFTTDKTQLV